MEIREAGHRRISYLLIMGNMGGVLRHVLFPVYFRHSLLCVESRLCETIMFMAVLIAENIAVYADVLSII